MPTKSQTPRKSPPDAAARAKHQPEKIAYSIWEACQATSLGRSTLYNHIASGRLRATRVAGRTIIPADALMALISGDGV